MSDSPTRGVAEAVRGGQMLRDAGLLPDVVHTSLLNRAIKTAQISLEECDRMWILVIRNWRLNERHYGALQGKNKKETLAQYGEEQFMLWRRSYDTPTADRPGQRMGPDHEARYAALLPDARPATECLADVVAWSHSLLAGRHRGRESAGGLTTLVVAHGNSLRALVKHLDQISDEDIAALNIPTGIPLVTGWTTSFVRSSAAASTWTRMRPPRQRRRWPRKAKRDRSARRPTAGSGWSPGLPALAGRRVLRRR